MILLTNKLASHNFKQSTIVKGVRMIWERERGANAH